MTKNTQITKWLDYENRVYDLFRSTGCHCTKDIIVQGVRGHHQIDIVVDLNTTESAHRWLIECKNWVRPVGKREVQAFKTVIDDVGADHGYMLCEKGFQKGAVDMASASNITLSSLSNLEEGFVDEQVSVWYQQSRAFQAFVQEFDDTGMFDSEAIVELRATGSLSVAENIIEIHIVRDSSHHLIIRREACGKLLTDEGSLRIRIPWDIPNLRLEHVYRDGVPVPTGQTTDHMELAGHYLVVFRTINGPVSIDAFVPDFT
jgi:hypothetical protein